MFDDYILLYNESNDIKSKVLQNINQILESMGKTIHNYHLTNHDICLNNEGNILKEIDEELQIVVDKKDIAAIKSLNSKQKYAYDTILENVFNEESTTFFIDGLGGSGKTYLCRTILATIRSKKLIALATTSSSVAASILPGGL